MTTVLLDVPVDDGVRALSYAADLIEANGLYKLDRWQGACTDREWKPGMPLCALAALCIALGKETGGDIANSQAVLVLLELLSDNTNAYHGFSHGTSRHFELSNYNDKLATTAEDVVRLMRSGAYLLEERAKLATEEPVVPVDEIVAATSGELPE